MGKKEKQTKPTRKVRFKAETIIAAYRILTKPNDQQTGEKGMKLSDLEPKDMYVALRAINSLRPVVTAFDDFNKDVLERLKPEGWDEAVERYNEMSESEKEDANKMASEYTRMVNECVQSELEKEKEVDDYERLSEEAFGKLIKSNGALLDVPSILLLQEVFA